MGLHKPPRVVGVNALVGLLEPLISFQSVLEKNEPRCLQTLVTTLLGTPTFSATVDAMLGCDVGQVPTTKI